MMTQRETTAGRDTDARRVCPGCKHALPRSAYGTKSKRYLMRSGEVKVFHSLIARCPPCDREFKRLHVVWRRGNGPKPPPVRPPGARYRTCRYCHTRRDLAEYTSAGYRCASCRDAAAPVRASSPAETEADLARVLDAVATAYEVTPLSILSRDRDPDTVEMRKVAIRVLWDLELGVTLIGRLVGLDHSTVLHHLGGFRHATDTEKWGVREVRGALGLRKRQLPETARPVRRVVTLREQEQQLGAIA